MGRWLSSALRGSGRRRHGSLSLLGCARPLGSATALWMALALRRLPGATPTQALRAPRGDWRLGTSAGMVPAYLGSLQPTLASSCPTAARMGRSLRRAAAVTFRRRPTMLRRGQATLRCCARAWQRSASCSRPHRCVVTGSAGAAGGFAGTLERLLLLVYGRAWPLPVLRSAMMSLLA